MGRAWAPRHRAPARVPGISLISHPGIEPEVAHSAAFLAKAGCGVGRDEAEPQLAAMYQDIVDHYLHGGETQVAKAYRTLFTMNSIEHEQATQVSEIVERFTKVRPVPVPRPSAAR